MRTDIFDSPKVEERRPPALSIRPTSEASLRQASKISHLHQWAEWVWLSAQFVWPTVALCECCPRAAVGICCPHPSPSRPASSLLLRTTTGSGTEHSVAEERDLTGYNSPTPSRKVTQRLMSLAMSAGYMFGHHWLGPLLDQGHGELDWSFWLFKLHLKLVTIFFFLNTNRTQIQFQ